MTVTDTMSQSSDRLLSLIQKDMQYAYYRFKQPKVLHCLQTQ